MNDIQDAVGYASLHGQLAQQHGRARVTLGRLEDVGIACRDGKGEHPEGNHGREVEAKEVRLWQLLVLIVERILAANDKNNLSLKWQTYGQMPAQTPRGVRKLYESIS
jgi:hypothetical protein